jgi:hypothetical protein
VVSEHTSADLAASPRQVPQLRRPNLDSLLSR